MKTSLKQWLMAGLLTAGCGLSGWIACNGAGDKPGAAETNRPPIQVAVNNAPLARGTNLTTSYAPLVGRVAPSVVSVFSTKYVRSTNPELLPFFNEPFFRRFFGRGESQPEVKKELSLGSGVIVTEDGYILTNEHVVEGAEEVQISLAAGEQKFTGKVIGRDALTDLAVLKIDTQQHLPTVTFANSDLLQVGDVALAIGNPFGVGQTVTMGIVSAVKRGGLGIEGYEDFIQTDAAINPGNSGGPLVDAEGRLIGINTAILSRTGGNQGIGFAIPSNLARTVMEQLVQHGKVVRGYLGVSIQDLTPELAKQFNAKSTKGALVASVSPNSAAAKAGLKNGDIIIDFNHQPVSDSRSLMMLVANTAPGTKAPVTILREGKQQTLTATLQSMPEKPAPGAKLAPPPSEQNRPLSGVTVTDLDPSIRKQLEIPDDVKGALITEIDPNSPAAAAGLRPGEVIEEIDHKPVENAKDAAEVGRAVKGKEALVRVWSRKGTHYVVVGAGGG